MAKKIVFQWGSGNPFAKATTERLLTMTQSGRDNFAAIYGLQVKQRLTYAEAAKELGECIMHALACDSIIDNR